MSNFYIESFKTFFKIGLFTLGGGYAMIPIIESEVVDKRKWVDKEDFLDIIAIAQSCPGVLAINVSVFIGYKIKKVKGAVCTCLGTALPSFLIILAIAMFFISLRTTRLWQPFSAAYVRRLWLLSPCLRSSWGRVPR